MYKMSGSAQSFQFRHGAAKGQYTIQSGLKTLTALFCTQPESTPKQAFLVEPIDPLQGFPLDLIFGLPRSQPIDHFGFEQADDRLSQGITVSNAADGRLQPGRVFPQEMSREGNDGSTSRQVYGRGSLVPMRLAQTVCPVSSMPFSPQSDWQRCRSRRVKGTVAPVGP